MAQLLVRQIEDDVKKRLQQRASRNGHSMEEEVRTILRNAVQGDDRPAAPLGTRVANRFKGLGLDQEIPELRGEAAQAAAFED